MSDQKTPAALFATAPQSIAEVLPPGAPQGNLPAVTQGATQLPALTAEVADNFGMEVLGRSSEASEKVLAEMSAGGGDEMKQRLVAIVEAAQGLNPKALGHAGGFFGLIKNAFGDAKEQIKAQFRTVEGEIDALEAELEPRAQVQRRRVADFEVLYQESMAYFKDMKAVFDQGTIILEAEKNAISALPAPADALQAQELADRQSRATRFSKRLYDIDTAVTLAEQTVVEIRLMQENSRLLVDKFDGIKHVTIPAFKKQFSLYLLQDEQKGSAEVANKVDDLTNEAIRRNAELLHQNSVTIAKQSQRAVVDIETVEKAQVELISTVQDIGKIMDEAEVKRKEGHAKLSSLRSQLVSELTHGKRTAA